MAIKYLRSAAAGAGTGADWTNAYTTLTLAFAGMAAGDTLYVADDHAESTAAAITLTSPGTASNPCRVLCVNTHVTVPPTALGTGATISTTGTSSITYAGFVYVYGITFTAGNGSGTLNHNFAPSSASWGWVMESCNLTIGSTGASCRIVLGLASASAGPAYLRLHNTTLTFAVIGQSIQMGNIRAYWTGSGSSIAGATIPTSLIVAGGPACGILEISGVDLSTLGSGKNLVSVASGSTVTVSFRNCKLGSSVSVITGTVAGPGGFYVVLDNSDSSATNYRMEHYKFQGSIVTETTKVKNGGASDGTTTISHKFVALTSGPTLFFPLEGPWMSVWNDTSGASKTVTVEFLHDSLTNLQNSDIYLEIEGLGTASFPESVYYNNRVADVFATPADCPAGIGTGNWTTTGLTNPNSQKLQVTFTPQVKGPIRARVCLIKSNYTVYVDPFLTVS